MVKSLSHVNWTEPRSPHQRGPQIGCLLQTRVRRFVFTSAQVCTRDFFFGWIQGKQSRCEFALREMLSLFLPGEKSPISRCVLVAAIAALLFNALLTFYIHQKIKWEAENTNENCWSWTGVAIKKTIPLCFTHGMSWKVLLFHLVGQFFAHFFGSVFAFPLYYWKRHIVCLKAVTIKLPNASKVGANDSGVDNKAGDYISTSRWQFN